MTKKLSIVILLLFFSFSRALAIDVNESSPVLTGQDLDVALSSAKGSLNLVKSAFAHLSLNWEKSNDGFYESLGHSLNSLAEGYRRRYQYAIDVVDLDIDMGLTNDDEPEHVFFI